MYALATSPPKPGLLADAGGGGAIEGELWQVPPASLASLLASLPEPMTLGPVELVDGRVVTGFFCQASATAGAREITALGGWRRFLEES
jgi:allophanate hydrolase